MPIETILVAIDLKRDSERVAGRAIQLANQHKAQILCIHVIEDLEFYNSSLPASIDAATLTRTIKDQSTSQLQGLLAKAELPAIVHLEIGNPSAAIESLARSCRADLIVVGPGTAKNFREKVFGTTVDRVVRSAPCPVLVVRQDANTPYKHVVVGMDLSAHAQAAALWASRLSPSASQELIHAFEIPLTFEQAMLKAGTSQPEINQYRTARADTVRRQILKLLDGSSQLTKTMRIKVVRGEAPITLIRASRRKKTDLVALGTQGANAMAQHLLGSVAQKVLTHARSDILVVPSTAIQGASA